jgi:tetratricopeptide (TPR) repeat protein
MNGGSWSGCRWQRIVLVVGLWCFGVLVVGSSAEVPTGEGRYELASLTQQEAKDHYRKAIAYLEDGHEYHATKELLEALKLEPNNPDLLARTGPLALETSETFHKEAREIFKRLNEVLKGQLTSLQRVDLARTLYMVEPLQLKEAAKHLETVLKEQPKFYEGLVAKGELLLLQNSFKEALDFFTRATSEGDKDGRGLWGLGYAHKGLGNIQEANRAFHRAYSWKPMDARNNVKMGKAFLGMGKEMLATKYFKLALEYDPNNLEANLGLLPILLKHNNDMTARPLLKKAQELDPQNPWVYYYQGYVFEMWGKVAKAIEQYEYAAHFGPQFIEAKLRLARVLAGIGHSFPGGVFTKENKNDLWEYQSFSNPKRALSLFKEVLELDPKHSEKAEIQTAINDLETHLEMADFMDETKGS